MRPKLSNRNVAQPRSRGARLFASLSFLATIGGVFPHPADAQQDLRERVQQLSEAMGRVQRQVTESQRQLSDLQQQLAAIQKEAGGLTPSQPSEDDSAASRLTAAVDDLREEQAVLESQAATHEQSKVESASKYPVKLSGMILMTAFSNRGKVDSAPTPSVALGGAGAAGATLRQSILGLEVRGPHILGASSRADIRMDFDASVSSGSTYGADAFGLARLRTAHAELNWNNFAAFFSLDKPLINPQTPDSLTAIGVPALAWSGNLWTWNPQLGVQFDARFRPLGKLQTRAAIIDVTDPPALFASSPSLSYTPPSSAELGRWPGIEATINLLAPQTESGLTLGIGGIFAPHRVSNVGKFDSWAGTVNFCLPLGNKTQISGSGYRGQGLGGLGAGAYKDFAYRTTAADSYFRALDDFGGWSQWKQIINDRLQFNEAVGIDNVPAHELRPFAVRTSGNFYNFARNRTFTGNLIYSPNAATLFSLEYRRLLSSFVDAPTQSSDIVGVGVGYKF